MINRVIAKIGNYNRIKQHNREQAYINKYFQMKNLPEEVRAVLYNARKGIADYANEKDVKIALSSSGAQHLNLEIKYPDGGGSTMNISSDINQAFPYSHKAKRVSYDDNFLRHIYRAISEIVK